MLENGQEIEVGQRLLHDGILEGGGREGGREGEREIESGKWRDEMDGISISFQQP